MILVTSYTNPDLDGVASAIAYAELLNRQGQEARTAFSETPHVEARYALERLGVSYDSLPVEYESIVLVDICRVIKLNSSLRAEKIIEVIDHHQGGRKEDFPNIKNFQVEMVGAAATLIEERWHAAGLIPSTITAQLLQGAIISNTLNFKAAVTTERDHASFARMAAVSPLPEHFAHEMFLTKSDLSGPRLAQSMRDDMSNFEVGTKKVGYFQLEIIGAQELLVTRRAEIEEILTRATSGEVDYSLLSIIDLEKGTTDLILLDPDFADLVGKVVGVPFSTQGLAHLDHFIMRKELRPLIQQLA